MIIESITIFQDDFVQRISNAKGGIYPSLSNSKTEGHVNAKFGMRVS